MSDLSVFGVQKGIENISGSDVKNTTILKDGSGFELPQNFSFFLTMRIIKKSINEA